MIFCPKLPNFIFRHIYVIAQNICIPYFKKFFSTAIAVRISGWKFLTEHNSKIFKLAWTRGQERPRE